MKFIVDECTGPSVSKWLKKLNHNVFCVYKQARGLNDKDFGELVFREKRLHKGLILLRLDNERTENKINILNKILNNCSDKIINNYIIATETAIRIIEKY